MANQNRTQGRHAGGGRHAMPAPGSRTPARTAHPNVRHTPQASRHAAHRGGRPASSSPTQPLQPSTPYARASYAGRTPQAPKPRSAKKYLVLGAALLLLALLLLFARSCPSFFPNHDNPLPAQDWQGLQWDSDRPAFFQDGECVSTIGIDVSENQGWIDWYQVAQDGISFAIVRAGNRGYSEGTLAADEMFDYNLDTAADAGLDVGVYFFSQATTVEEAQEEADFVLQMIDGRKLQMPVVFDHETIATADGRANSLDAETITECALAFCDRIEQAGYSTMIYGNSGDLWRFDLNAFDDSRPLWYAEYGTSQPSTELVIKMWQYSNVGTVAGIDTDVDMNLLIK